MDRARRRRPATMRRALLASLQVGGLASGAVVVALLGVAYAGAYVAGGSAAIEVRLFDVAVVVAAVRFGPVGGLVAAVAATILSGPLLADDVQAGIDESVHDWVGRGIAFLLEGQLVGWLTTQTLPNLRHAHGLQQASRELQTAIENEDLRVHYQPLVDLASNRAYGVEALVRWQHPQRGLLLPAAFVPLAEESGDIRAIDKYVLKRVLSDVVAWLAEHDEVDAMTVSVNVSADHLLHSGFPRGVQRCLAASGLPARMLQMEVTETGLISDLAAARSSVAELRRHGVRIAVDDFGTGRSSLAYLETFAPDVIKLDKYFVDALVGPHAEAHDLVGGVVRLAHSLRATVVAEGIETLEQLALLRELGCDGGQGFLFSPAVPWEAVRLGVRG